MLETLSYYYYTLWPTEVPEPFNTIYVKILLGVWIGACLGSFISMLSYRLPRKLSLLKSESYCPSCHHDLGWRDLVPILSWLIAGGRCRYCSAPIGTRYLVIELITTAASSLAFCLIGYSLWQIGAQILLVAVITTVIILLEWRS